MSKSETSSPLGKGPYRVYEAGSLSIHDAANEWIGIALGGASSTDPEAIARLFAASWSFYQAAKLRAEWFRLLDLPCPSPDLSMDAIRDAEMAWLAMEAQAMAIAEGRPLPVTQDAEAR